MNKLLRLSALALVACGPPAADPDSADVPEVPDDTGVAPSEEEPPVEEDPPPAADCTEGDAIVGDVDLPLDEALAAAVAGDVLTVCAGIHEGPFVAAVPVVVNGDLTDPTLVVLDGGGRDATLTLVAGSELHGLTITGGHANLGGGLRITGVGTAIVDQCAIEGNDATIGGGGLYLGPGVVADLTGSVIRENYAEAFGGGVWLEAATLIGGEIADNQAAHTGDYTPAYGGGGLAATGTAEVRGAEIHDNVAVYGGGVSVVDGDLLLTDVSVHANRAVESPMLGGGAGGGANVAQASLTLGGTTELHENVAEACGGGAVMIDAAILQGVVRDNVGGVYGGGLCLLEETTVDGVELRANGLDPSGWSGGGVAVVVGTATLFDTVVTGNAAQNGGGVAVDPEAVVDVVGGEVSANTARSGAGVYGSDDSTVLVEGTAIVDNVATELGGALWVGGITRITGATILRNSGSDVGGAYLEPDAVLLESTATDWGVDADDNLPADVGLFDIAGMQFVLFSYGEDATFSCTADDCPP